jgi:hypothetical protein
LEDSLIAVTVGSIMYLSVGSIVQCSHQIEGFQKFYILIDLNQRDQYNAREVGRSVRGLEERLANKCDLCIFLEGKKGLNLMLLQFGRLPMQ